MGMERDQHIPKKTKRVIFEMTDNMVWSRDEKDVLGWCKRNKAFDETKVSQNGYDVSTFIYINSEKVSKQK